MKSFQAYICHQVSANKVGNKGAPEQNDGR